MAIPMPRRLLGKAEDISGVFLVHYCLAVVAVMWGGMFLGSAAAEDTSTRAQEKDLPAMSGSIVGWGEMIVGVDLTKDFIATAAGGDHNLGLKKDGSITAWGNNRWGQCEVPEPNTDFVALAAGYQHSLGLKKDGSILTWGNDEQHQCDIPTTHSPFIAIAAGYEHSLAIRADGSIMAWGKNDQGQCDIPTTHGPFVAVAAGWNHSLAVRKDGSVVAWGRNQEGQCSVPAPNTGFITIAAGSFHSIALKKDGSVVGWGGPYSVRSYVHTVPANNRDFVAIAAGNSYYSFCLRSDGEIVILGQENEHGSLTLSLPGKKRAVSIAAGYEHGLGIMDDGSVQMWGEGDFGCSLGPVPNSGFVSVAVGRSHYLCPGSPGNGLPRVFLS